MSTLFLNIIVELKKSNNINKKSVKNFLKLNNKISYNQNFN
nr:MAG TPA: hypothetical protein [Caudoviricetes sp.]DAT65354.1 MAG TPA: hypothetical protein [Caudoviricetes sp.]DAX62620.1 MAG TPA: hypothetical protein [Caudoviricetes sp.]